ncbi:MAG: hypothetical protein C4541_04915 [Candidatus Auribacter fodinae]|jgi:Zn-dependent protease with chaperone function|uniref:Peptidase M48 domain-containing protein n=1 Tax=Candidatus Auribacter fodinae TaxID=2093366 RepID=A0A3A4REV9_9BACT|nr:MAG: hypothetical protein C4541_04915 [Candidatus Auribacter fodinae]
MKMGAEYKTNLSADRVLEIIQAESQQLGYQINPLPSDTKLIRLTYSCPSAKASLKALLHRIPTDIDWEISTRDNETCIYCNSKLSGAYLPVIFFFLIVTLICFPTGQIIFNSNLILSFTVKSLLYLILSTISLVLGYITYSLIEGRRSYRLFSILGKIRLEAIQEHGYFIDYKPQSYIIEIGYLIFIVMFFCIVLLLDPINLQSGWFLNSLFFSFVLITVFISVFFFIYYIKGSGMRLFPGLSGISSAFAIILLLSAQCPWYLENDSLKGDKRKFLEEVQQYLTSDNSLTIYPMSLNSNPIQSKKMVEFPAKLKSLGWALWCGTFLVISLSIFAFWSGIDTLFEGYTYLYQMTKHLDSRWTQNIAQGKSFTGKSFMKIFRILFSTLWIILSIAIIAELAYLIWSMSYYNQTSSLNWYKLSVISSYFAFNASFNNTLVSCAIHYFWLVYFFVIWGFFMISVGSFIIQDLVLFLKVRGKNLHINDKEKELNEKIASTWRKQSLQPPPVIILNETSTPIAKAHYIAFSHFKMAIEISTGYIDYLNSDELDAVLGHEMVHCLKKHCLLNYFLRLIGRLTFVGDGFVWMLQDSFGYEVQADRLAVELFGVKPRALKDSLGQYHIAKMLDDENKFKTATGISIESNEIGSDHGNTEYFNIRQLTLKKRLRYGLKLFIQQYIGIAYTGDWHPSMDYRVAMLDTME